MDDHRRRLILGGQESLDLIEHMVVAIAPRTVHVRDSKDVTGPRLALPPAAWARLVTYASER